MRVKRLFLCVRFSIIVMTLIISLSTSVFSYQPMGHKLVGGVYNRGYYVGCTSPSYITACVNAIGDWNWVVNPYNNGVGVDFYFTRVYTVSAGTIRFWGENRPNNIWTGLTRVFDANGNQLNEQPGPPSIDWTRASIIFNTVWMPSDASEMRKIAAHEIGHAAGLAHTEDTGTIMYKNSSHSTATGPTLDEKNGVIDIYS